MANSANTSWKLTNLENGTLWSADSNELVDNLNQQVGVAFEKYDRPRDDQDNWMSLGLDGRSITFQGVGSYDSDLWKLSSNVNGKQLMKFWAGEDWFSYVLGKQCTIIRDQGLPLNASFTVALIGVDPFWYFANQTVGSGSGLSSVVPYCYQDDGFGAGDIIVDLSQTGTNEPTTYVEPVFWVRGGTSTDMSALTITDDGGRTLTADFKDGAGTSGACGNGDDYLILPWRRKALEGYMIQDSCIVKLESGSGLTYPTGDYTPTGGAAANAGDWGLDAMNLDRIYVKIDGSQPRACINTVASTVLKRIKGYPRAEYGISTTFDLSATGTSTNAHVYAQWCYRRL